MTSKYILIVFKDFSSKLTEEYFIISFQVWRWFLWYKWFSPEQWHFLHVNLRENHNNTFQGIYSCFFFLLDFHMGLKQNV